MRQTVGRERVYHATRQQLADIPRLAAGVPDVLDPMSLSELKERLRPFRGEIKGILTRSQMVGGIGNAYAGEILFDAKIYPFKKRKTSQTKNSTGSGSPCRTLSERPLR